MTASRTVTTSVSITRTFATVHRTRSVSPSPSNRWIVLVNLQWPAAALTVVSNAVTGFTNRGPRAVTSRVDAGITFAAGVVGGYTNFQCTAAVCTAASATSLGWFFSFSTLGYKGIQVSFSAAPAISAVSPGDIGCRLLLQRQDERRVHEHSGHRRRDLDLRGDADAAHRCLLVHRVHSAMHSRALATMKPLTLVLPVAADTSSNVNVKLIPAGSTVAAKQVGFNPIVITALAAG